MSPPVSRRVPLRLIAEKAGVSRMTVSLALRASPAISKETGSRVQEIALQLGYRPDPVVSDLMANLRLATRSQNAISIAAITCQREWLSPRDFAKQAATLAGAKAKAASLGYHVEEFRLGLDGMSPRRIGQIMQARNMEGALLFPGRAARETLARLDADAFACVALGEAGISSGISQIDLDRCHAAMEAATQVRALGYRAPGLLITKEGDQSSTNRTLAGFLADQHLLGEGGSPRVLIQSRLDYGEFARWMRQQRPDAILHATEAPLLTSCLAALGLRVPHDVGLVSLERTPLDENESGIELHAGSLGAAAIELVAAAWANRERGKPTRPINVSLRGEWVPGSTTRSVSAEANFARVDSASGEDDATEITPMLFAPATEFSADQNKLRAS